MEIPHPGTVAVVSVFRQWYASGLWSCLWVHSQPSLSPMRTLLILAVLFVVCGCKRKSEKTPITPTQSWDSLMVHNITPSGDGGIYITDVMCGLWYSRAGTAVRVTLNGAPINEYVQVIPSNSAGVYLVGGANLPALLYAEGGIAKAVREVGSASELDSAHGTWDYATISYLKKREAQIEEARYLESQRQEQEAESEYPY